MILCFSGTGNSRYIARQIAKISCDEVLDLNAKIKANDCSKVQTGSNVVIVTPTYAWRIPRIVSAWLSKTELAGAKRIWFVMDCGDGIGNAAEYNRKIADKKKIEYMGTARIVMPENYIAMFNAPNADEARKIAEKAKPDIEKTAARIKAGQTLDIPQNKLYDRFMSGVVNPIFYSLFVKATAFFADDACTGCGQCVQKCPMNNIHLDARKPVWGNKCTHCMACICYCPTKAIEYGKRSIGKPRYHFEVINDESCR